jgi:hypothetical protein
VGIFILIFFYDFLWTFWTDWPEIWPHYVDWIRRR